MKQNNTWYIFCS